MALLNMQWLSFNMEIIVMKLKGKEFFPIQVHSEEYYFYYRIYYFYWRCARTNAEPVPTFKKLFKYNNLAFFSDS